MDLPLPLKQILNNIIYKFYALNFWKEKFKYYNIKLFANCSPYPTRLTSRKKKTNERKIVLENSL